MFLLNFVGDISACNVRNKQYEEKGESARAYIYERIYMLICTLEFPSSGLGVVQHPEGPLSQHPTKQIGIWTWQTLVESRVWTWISTIHADLCLRDTPEPAVPRVH